MNKSSLLRQFNLPKKFGQVSLCLLLLFVIVILIGSTISLYSNIWNGPKHECIQSPFLPVLQSLSRMVKVLSWRSVEQCPIERSDWEGPLEISTQRTEDSEIVAGNLGLECGGRWRPIECRARQKVAVIIPFRDRHFHLRTWQTSFRTLPSIKDTKWFSIFSLQ